MKRSRLGTQDHQLLVMLPERCEEARVSGCRGSQESKGKKKSKNATQGWVVGSGGKKNGLTMRYSSFGPSKEGMRG